MKRLWNLYWEKISAILTVIVIAGGWIGDKLSDGWVVSALQTLWTWIKAILFFEIAVIWIICGLLLLIFALYVWVRLSNKATSQEEVSLPTFFSYTSDVFNGYTYEWGYYQNYPDDIYAIDRDSMQIICPECGTAIYVCKYSSNCPRCNKYIDYNLLKPLGDIVLVIEDNIRRNKYDTK